MSDIPSSWLVFARENYSQNFNNQAEVIDKPVVIICQTIQEKHKVTKHH